MGGVALDLLQPVLCFTYESYLGVVEYLEVQERTLSISPTMERGQIVDMGSCVIAKVRPRACASSGSDTARQSADGQYACFLACLLGGPGARPCRELHRVHTRGRRLRVVRRRRPRAAVVRARATRGATAPAAPLPRLLRGERALPLLPAVRTHFCQPATTPPQRLRSEAKAVVHTCNQCRWLLLKRVCEPVQGGGAGGRRGPLPQQVCTILHDQWRADNGAVHHHAR
eukprot:scaffold2090_cov225-Prasinococcus_capsulatus_cf.AAC.17